MPKLFSCEFPHNIPFAATIAMIIDVDVLELCTNTVTRTPIIKPHIGLANNDFCENNPPADFPPRSRKDDVKTFKAQTNK